MSAEHADALITGPVRGRGAGINPGNRFEDVRLHVLGEHLDDEARDRRGVAANVRTEVLDDHSRTVINKVDSPDLGMRWTFNPYRGCEHGCVYCYARPTHETLGFSCGLDFETRIMAKRDAPALLRKELSAPRWAGEPIVMSGVTDPYQPLEARLRLVRACLEVFVEFRQPIAIITKNRMITRDLDLLRELAVHGTIGCAVSITTLDRTLAAKMEPRASSPSDRLRAIEELSSAGIPVSVMTAPIIPGLNDHEIPAILKAASEAGASGAGYVLLRLPHQLKGLFLDWLHRHYPDRAGKVEGQLREARDGKLYDATFGTRQRGVGARAEQIGRTFDVFSRRYGLNDARRSLNSDAFRKPVGADGSGQMGLFASD
ncbi:MAG: PA0069 family radical SAM protein [Phycisphaeraceae bacterium]|nr:MAG: PA0069 family radical SAM protein [Phycisphaeraceae bacterium]